MKKGIAVLAVFALLSIAFFTYNSRLRSSLTSEVRKAFPELSTHPEIGYIPWPVGPELIVNLPVDHPLYKEHIQNINSGKDGSIYRGKYQALVMSSDGTTFIRTNR